MDKQFILAEEKSIFENLKQKNENQIIIRDGIIDVDEYINSELKILWINKEVNSEDEDEEWDLREVLFNLEENGKIKKGWEKTFNPIIYIIYGIFNNENYDDIPNTWDNPIIIEYLRRIAYVNVKKIPGGSVAMPSELLDFHSKYSHILEKQIKLYKPNVIICGNTYNLIESLLDKIFDKERNMKFEIDNRNKNNIFYFNDEVIIVDAYHPSHRTNKQEYCDGIINGVLYWLNNKDN